MSIEDQQLFDEACDRFELGLRVLDAILDSDDRGLEQLTLDIKASASWRGGASPFAELVLLEILATAAIPGWPTARRVARVRAFARMAGFIN